MDQWLINSETVHHGLNDVHNSHILGPTFVQMYFCILTAKQFVSFVYGVKIHALYLPKIFLRLTDWTQSSLPSHQCPPHKTQRRLISKQVFFKSCSLSFLSMTIIVSLMCKISGDVIDRLGWFFFGGGEVNPYWTYMKVIGNLASSTRGRVPGTNWEDRNFLLKNRTSLPHSFHQNTPEIFK